MAEGVPVTAYDARGDVIGVGTLEEGTRADGDCVWRFTVGNLPEAAFYRVEVSHRGKVTVQRANVGTVSLKLG